MLLREILQIPSFKNFFDSTKKRGTRQQRGFTGQTRLHQNLVPAMHRVDPSLNKKVEELRKDGNERKEAHKRVLNQKDFAYITNKYDIRNITKESPRYLGKTKIKLYWDSNVGSWCLLKESISMEITPEEIIQIGNKVKWDVCVLGLELAEKFSTTENEYNDIWTAAQHVFDTSQMSSDLRYILLPQYIQQYANTLTEYIKSGKYIGQARGEDFRSDKDFKKIVTESAASPFLKFYKTLGNGDWKYAHTPDDATLWECLHLLEKYYTDYIRWYKRVRPKLRDGEQLLIQDYNLRLADIIAAQTSDDNQKKIQAIDNGINQWHIDYPVIAHLEMDLDDEAPGENTEWEELTNILIKLGKLAKKSPYTTNSRPRPGNGGL